MASNYGPCSKDHGLLYGAVRWPFVFGLLGFPGRLLSGTCFHLFGFLGSYCITIKAKSTYLFPVVTQQLSWAWGRKFPI